MAQRIVDELGRPGLGPQVHALRPCHDYKAVSHAPREAPWFWGLEFNEWQDSDGPQYGQVASLKAAKQAFRAAWDRRPKAGEKS